MPQPDASESPDGTTESPPREKAARTVGLALSKPPVADPEDGFDEDLSPTRHMGGGLPAPLGRATTPSPSKRPQQAPDEPGEHYTPLGLLDDLNPATPPAGLDTPSEPRTPSPSGTPRQSYSYTEPQAACGEAASDGLMCLDQWDWKTDAPEFVPGSLRLGGSPPQPQSQPPQPPAQQQSSGQLNAQDQWGGAPCMPSNAGYNQAAWPLPPNDGRTENAPGAWATTMNDTIRLNQVRAEYEWQMRPKSEELREMQNRMNQLEIEAAQQRASWEIERRSLVRQIGHYRAVLERYCIPLDEAGCEPSAAEEERTTYFPAFEPSAPSQWNARADTATARSDQTRSLPVPAVPKRPGAGAGPGTPTAAGASGAGGASSAGGGGGGGANATASTASSTSPWAGGANSSPWSGNASGGYRSALAGGPAPAPQPGSGPQGDPLNSKMRQLNNLIREGHTAARRHLPDGTVEPPGASGGGGSGAAGATSGCGGAGSSPTGASTGASGASGAGGGVIASTLRAMFPHATIRTKAAPTGGDPDLSDDAPEPLPMVAPQTTPALDRSAPSTAPPPPPPPASTPSRSGNSQDALLDMAVPGEPEVRGIERYARRLERATGGQIDERASRALLGLTAKDAREALHKVDELVQQQGGTCRNLSSILQSVCRKIEKRSSRPNRDLEDGGVQGARERAERAAAQAAERVATGTAAVAASTLSAPLGGAASAGGASTAVAPVPSGGVPGPVAASGSSREERGGRRRDGSGGRRERGSEAANTPGVSGPSRAEQREQRAPRQQPEGSDATANKADGRGPGRFRRGPRQDDEDGDVFAGAESSGSADAGGHDVNGDGGRGDEGLARSTSQLSDTPSNAARRSKNSWADVEDHHSVDDDSREDRRHATGASEEGASQASEANDAVWTAQRVEKAARRGFELRRRGDHWDLKISMASLEPPFTEAGMERYCRWLGTRFSAFREENGVEALRRCRGEVDFSHNGMSDQMVWRLLEVLAQHEVHAALLKLFANHISQGGVLAICEFIRMNHHAEALQELHLSHNDIDDRSALELLRTLQSQRPRYPPRRVQDGNGEPPTAPVWLRLNHNKIKEPDAVRKTAEAEGIAICTAWDRNACGTSKCCRRECPLVHLYSFNVQANRRCNSAALAPEPAAAAAPAAAGREATGEGEEREGRSRRNRTRKAERESRKKERLGDAGDEHSIGAAAASEDCKSPDSAEGGDSVIGDASGPSSHPPSVARPPHPPQAEAEEGGGQTGSSVGGGDVREAAAAPASTASAEQQESAPSSPERAGSDDGEEVLVTRPSPASPPPPSPATVSVTQSAMPTPPPSSALPPDTQMQ